MRREWATVVVQCPSCQSKFRIADEKVTDRGVRVRCTACKNVFQVKRSGAQAETKKTEQQAVTGTTQEMHAIDQSVLASLPGAGRPAGSLSRPPQANAPPAPNPGQTAVFAVPAAAPVAKAPPATPGRTSGKPAPARPAPAAAPAGNGARRLVADDLFGMSELTGDTSAPRGSALSSHPSLPPVVPPARPAPAAKPVPAARPAPTRPPARPAGAPARRPAPSADDFDAALDAAVGASSGAPPAPEAGSTPLDAGAAPARPPGRSPPPPPPDALEGDSPAPPPEPPSPASKLPDPFEGVDLAAGGGEPDAGPVELAARPPAEKPKPEKAPARSAPPAIDSTPPRSARREVVNSALTGLVGAALAIAVVVASSLNEGGTGWFGLGAGSDVVATHVVSGLYDTASGRPVFFVRGRVVNKGKRPRGPVRVIAELVTENGAEARSEAFAGQEPTPEDVYSIRSPQEAEKLARSLLRGEGDRRLAPGGSLPFFAVIPDPPADLHRHKLQVRLETVDAWSGPGQGGTPGEKAAPPAGGGKAPPPPKAPAPKAPQ